MLIFLLDHSFVVVHYAGIEVSIRRESNDSVDERHNGTAVHSLVLEASISITNNTDNREKSSSLSFIKALPSYSRGITSLCFNLLYNFSFPPFHFSCIYM